MRNILAHSLAVTVLVGFGALPAAAADPAPGGVLVVTANPRDYIFGAGGALAEMIGEGTPVYVAQFGNGEKDSVGLGPAQSRIANRDDAERAAKTLGVRETLYLGHKSGELAQLSSSELRNQVMALVRHYKPRTLFFPDWYLHFQGDDDVYRVGRMAEEAPYGGGSYFLQEMTYIGHPGFAAREYYFYSADRPYRPREGGEGKAALKAVDISETFELKLAAAGELKTSNLRYARWVRAKLTGAGRPTRLLEDLTQPAAERLVEAYLAELAATIGRKHNLRRAEEFNYLSPSVATVPEHIRERAR